MRAAAPAKTAENISWLIAIIYGLGAGNTHTYACAVHTYIHTYGHGPSYSKSSCGTHSGGAAIK